MEVRDRRRYVARVEEHDAVVVLDRAHGLHAGQSGVVEDFAWLDPSAPPVWIERIEADASTIVERDPSLAAPEHRALALAVRRFAVAIAVREEAG